MDGLPGKYYNILIWFKSNWLKFVITVFIYFFLFIGIKGDKGDVGLPGFTGMPGKDGLLGSKGVRGMFILYSFILSSWDIFRN